jgi:hypothetical protein
VFSLKAHHSSISSESGPHPLGLSKENGRSTLKIERPICFQARQSKEAHRTVRLAFEKPTPVRVSPEYGGLKDAREAPNRRAGRLASSRRRCCRSRNHGGVSEPPESEASHASAQCHAHLRRSNAALGPIRCPGHPGKAPGLRVILPAATPVAFPRGRCVARAGIRHRDRRSFRMQECPGCPKHHKPVQPAVTPIGPCETSSARMTFRTGWC